MSGSCGPMASINNIAAIRSAECERGDVLAYLARKRVNAETMAARSPEFADEARWTIRQLDVIRDDLRAGLHIELAGAPA